MQPGDTYFSFQIPTYYYFETEKQNTAREAFCVEALVLVSAQILDGNFIYLPLYTQVVAYYYIVYYTIDRRGSPSLMF